MTERVHRRDSEPEVSTAAEEEPHDWWFSSSKLRNTHCSRKSAAAAACSGLRCDTRRVGASFREQRQ